MQKIVSAIQATAPHIRYETGTTFFWSPDKQSITYDPHHLDDQHGIWALLHETAHALLGHTAYETDFELLKLEVQAWDKAKALGSELDIIISEDHIQDCLDTYRDWLHQRSTCPICGTTSLQETARQYRCHNCNSTWQVTAARFCRPYRLRNTSSKNKKSPEPVTTQTTFQ